MTHSAIPAPVVSGRAADLAQFSPQGFGRRILFETERMKVVLVAFEPGQGIPLHAPDVDLVFAVLEGGGEVMAGDRACTVRAGDLVIVPAGATRGIRARGGRMIALHVVSPPPTAADHARMSEGASWPAEADVDGSLAEHLRTEHEPILQEVAALGALAEEAALLSDEGLREMLRPAVRFLQHELLPHAAAEDRAIYPAVDRLLRSVGGATKTMEMEHRSIESLTARLAEAAEAPWTPSARARVNADLVRLAVLVSEHIAKEDEVYVPLLELLGADETRAIRRALQGDDADAH